MQAWAPSSTRQRSRQCRTHTPASMLANRANSAPSVLRSRGLAAEGCVWASSSSCPISSLIRPSRRRTMVTDGGGDGRGKRRVYGLHYGVDYGKKDVPISEKDRLAAEVENRW